MIKSIPCLIVVLLICACDQPPAPTKAKVEKDPRVAAIEERIAKVTPEAKQTIEKLKVMKPEVNGQVSTQSLSAIIDDYATNKGTFNIKPIGWEASQKKNLRWKLTYHYQDYNGQLLAAEWEYNPETNKLYPFEKDNAPVFWTSVGGDKQPEGDKKKK
ncbi:MAG TPA: hypothetical protein VJH03_11275 [Blastocatellia bacterium]|nr:hypothetical protein [Blastocatellia bacterium]